MQNATETNIGLDHITFLFDNSSLSEFLTDKLIQESVAQSSDNISLFVSIDTLSELAKGDEKKVVARLHALAPLLTSLHPKVFIAKGLLTLLKKERRNRGNLKSIPLLINSPKWQSFVSSLQQDDVLIDAVSKHKARMLEKNVVSERMKQIDIFLRKSASPKNQSSIRERLLEFDQEDEIKNLLFDHRNLSLSRSVFKKIIKTTNQEKFPTHRLYIYLIQMRMLGNQLNVYPPGDTLRFLNKIKLGNWYDIAILAQSYSYTYFVSDDKDQRDFCNFLRSLGVSKCLGISLAEMNEIIFR
ncbi:hypothetical protein [Bdellovibrio sp. HCB2-146]|uniref:hypothetical protein n=1 Tax=Bdellovibrio sp. HCB2-146 TaxID=3394362 RepID=UPI0039BCEE27